MSANGARIFQNNAINEIAKVISQITGNQFSEKHGAMIEFRLKKRCLELSIQTIEEYFNYFRKNQEIEVKQLVSLLTTHHTFFFREFSHFQYLEERILPELIPIVRKRGDKKIKIWSAACSKGHEVYSLAMFLDHTLKLVAPDLSYSILGTDIDSESIAYAQNGVYSRKEIKEVPLSYLGTHWARGTGEISEFVKAKSSLRNSIQWMQANLLAVPENLPGKYDLIFCRNVFIYFNQEQIKKSSISLVKYLEPHGYYFIGLSESLNGMNLPLVSQGPSIYRQLSVVEAEKNAAKISSKSPSTLSKDSNLSSKSNIKETFKTLQSKDSPSPSPVMATKDILRVLCVDDSGSILTLLKRVLTKEDGFEVVGTASNGIEASAKVKELKPDIMTLDIHMPQQTGIEYLEKNYNSSHPPVVMISSVSREESDLALKALHLGAADYVEKPALSNLREVGDEIKRKLRTSYRNLVVYKQQQQVLQLDDSFKSTARIMNPQNYLRLVIAQLSDKQRVTGLINELGRGQPPTFILFDGVKDTLKGFAEQLKISQLKPIDSWPTQSLKADDLYVIDAKKFVTCLNSKHKDIPVSILCLGEISPYLKDLFKQWTKSQILFEDLGTKQNAHSQMREFATDTVPVTSFAYMSIEFFGRIK